MSQPGGPGSGQQAIYTTDPATQLIEILTADPNIPKEIKEQISKNWWGFDYRTLSTTQLSEKTLRRIRLLLSYMEMRGRILQSDLENNIQEADAIMNLRVLVYLAGSRSEGGWFMERGTGPRLNQVALSNYPQEKKKRFKVF